MHVSLVLIIQSKYLFLKLQPVHMKEVKRMYTHVAVNTTSEPHTPTGYQSDDMDYFNC